ncbi:MAG TPA: lipoprotein [Bradyrhizobium sp.]|jgi:predicted small lipoprotein YifL|nr:lipoprotein [Bradyrhizobium sp.]
MVPPNLGIVAVNRTSSPVSAWTLVALTAIALALAGCGRKGPLDLPPSAAGQPVVEQGDTDEERAAAKGTVFDPSFGANGQPKAAKGIKKPFLLDPLLNSD